MTTYQIASSRVSGHQLGDIVTDDDLSGINVHALLVGGHLKPAPTPKPPTIKPAAEQAEED
jgi:hypothetical protein